MMNSGAQGLRDIVLSWQGKRIGVIGDVMLDHYIEGEVTRISPEAPVPIVNVKREWYAPGGAANVAANIASLGGEVELSGVIGVDEAGDQLVRELKKRGVSFRATCFPDRPTTEKTRILVGNQQLVRIDREACTSVDSGRMQQLWNELVDWKQAWDVVVISDYAKGVLATGLPPHIIECARRRQKPVIGDAKPQNIRAFYGATVLMPNELEMRAVLEGLHVENYCAAAKTLETLFLVTLGEKGMVSADAESIEEYPTIPRDVSDNVGAGDTATAAVALALAFGTAIPDAARIANAAAGVVVGKRGTATVSTDELLAALDEMGVHEMHPPSRPS
ncbi:MAG: PfkB family carbohydrate kinase [bacterium]|nr:PfkB family carbohydrate kinase [bacterium]MDZ4284258.1 PfkB family carbohydrate kinase [Patescibacteria group bacterium]